MLSAELAPPLSCCCLTAVTQSTCYNLHCYSAPCACPGDETIKHLVSRGAHRRFSYQSLMVMLAWYFLGAAVAAGSAISSGLFVPMLM